MTAASNEPTEYVRTTQPFVVRRRAIWGECDPAGVVYTPRYTDYTVSATQLFLAHVLGAGGFMEGKRRHSFGTPCKALSCVFHSSLKPDQTFEMKVAVTHVGRTTFELAVAGTTLDGALIFDARLTTIAVAYAQRVAIPVPDSVLAALEPYR